MSEKLIRGLHPLLDALSTDYEGQNETKTGQVEKQACADTFGHLQFTDRFALGGKAENHSSHG